MDRSQPQTNLMDQHDRLIADILTHYRTLMFLATTQADEDAHNARPEALAVGSVRMNRAFDGLKKSVEELLALSRRIKELWVFGPLGQGDPLRDAREDKMEADVASFSTLLNDIEASGMMALAQRNGGTWARLTKDAPPADAAS